MNSTQNLPDTLCKYLNVSRMKDFLNNPGVSFSSVAKFDDKREGICTSYLPNNQAEDMLRMAYENSPYGVLCMCENSLSVPMWEKYAEMHCGIMVSFNPTHSFFNKDPFEKQWNKVSYTDEVPILPPAPIDIIFGSGTDEHYRKSVFGVLRQAILRKDAQWSFEEEWRKRAVLSRPKCWDSHLFPQAEIHDIIHSVSMGANISKEHKTLCQEFTSRYNILLYQAEIVNSSTVRFTLPSA